MRETRDSAELAEWIRPRTGPGSIIGIDGAYGSGKSHLAADIANRLGLAHVKIDDFASKTGQPYLLQLRYPELRQRISGARAQGAVLVDGICLWGVFERLAMVPDVTVYVKKFNDDGYWADEETCDLEIIDLNSPMLQSKGAALARDVAAYHQGFDPVPKADYIFARIV